jgi:TonB-linked SusC/RagA family outer membrane protein
MAMRDVRPSGSGRFRIGSVLCVAIGIAATARPAAGQQSGAITGLVRDSATTRPIAARVQLSQTGQIVAVNTEGRYLFRGIAPGSYEVRVVAIGYASQRKTVAVAAGDTAQADFTLAAVPYTLQEIVTTATGEQRRIELGNTVGTVRADSLTTYSPVTSMATLLQGRVADVVVLPSSGTTGAGTRIRIRGANSPSLSNEPLIYIDGVKVNSNASSSTLATGGQEPSRFNDINPEEIESIEIVKGPSAATLYGTEAANGVIRITTKRGRAGPARWNFYAEGGLLKDANDYPNNYEGIGHELVNGVPGTDPVACLLVEKAAGLCTIDSVSTLNPLMTKGVTPIQTGYRQQYGGSVSGGSEFAQYFLSGEYEGETGTYKLPEGEENRLLQQRGVSSLPDYTIRPNRLKKVSARANLDFHPTSKVDFTTSVGYVSSDTRLPQNDNNVLGMLPSGYFGYANAADTVGNSGWGFFQPGEIFSLLRNQNMERFTGSATGTWRALKWLTGRASFGYDVGNRTEISYDQFGVGPQFGTTPLGNKTDTRTQLRTYTVDASATATYGLSHAWSSRTTVGGQYVKDYFFQNFSSGDRLAAGSEDIDGAGILTAGETTTTSVKVGGFVEQMFSLNDRLFLTGAVRVDDNSAFGTDFNAVVFPKASVSWLISDEPFFPKSGFLSLLRLRAAFGASGRQPQAQDALTFLTPTSAAVAGVSTSAVTFGGLGLKDLKPERSQEFEAGIDAQFFNDRFNVELTGFTQKTRDALIGRILAPSLGASNGILNQRIENLGRLSSRGLELTLNGRTVNTRALTWDFQLSGSLIRNRLEELGAGIPPVVNGIQRHTPGYPLGGFWELPIKSFADANDDGIIDPSEVVVGDTAEFAGSPTPTREASLGTTVALANGRVRLQGQLDYKGGFVQYNLTEVFRCTATGNNCRGINDPSASLFEQARAVARRFLSPSTNWGYIEDAEFLKLRELSVSWVVPERWAHAFGASALTLTGAARNLLTWTGYTGVDPEVNGLGQSIFNGFGVVDFLTQPPVRTFIVRANVSF